MEEEILKQEQAEVKQETKEQPEKDIQKVYIKDYGNLVLEIVGSNDIGLMAHSAKRSEDMFIPWTSIIFISKIKDVTGA